MGASIDPVTPFVTVMIPSYNYGHYIADAVDSALAQTHAQLEVLVIENASTDGTRAVLARYAGDARVRVIEHDVNVSRAANVNRGIAAARGDYIVTLPADDALLPDFISSALRYYAAHPWVDVVHRQFVYTDANLAMLHVDPHAGYLDLAAYERRDELTGLLLFYSYAQLVTAVVPRWVFERVGPFDDELTVAFDYGYMTRIAAAGVRIAYSDEPVYLHRRHEVNASGASFRKSGRDASEYLHVLEGHAAAPQFNALAPNALAFYDQMASLGNTPEALGRVAASRPRVAALRARAAEFAAQPQTPIAENAHFTIVLPAGRDINGLARALASLEAQTYPHWDVVVVAYEAPNLDVLLGRYPWRERINYARLARGHTAAHARNAGVQLATGDLVGFLSDRETFAPEHLQTMLTALRQSGQPVARGGVGVTIEHAPTPDGLPPGIVGSYQLGNEHNLVRIVSPYPPLAALCHRRDIRLTFAPLAYFSEWLYALQLGSLTAGASFQNITTHRHVPLTDAQAIAADLPRVLESLDSIFTQSAAIAPPPLIEARATYRRNLIAAAERVQANPNDGRNCAGLILALDDLALPAPAAAAT